jgi:DNA-binding PadR family transcriptional regulator
MSIRAALLQLLDEGPQHGYGLQQAFQQRTGGVWPLNIGQVYTTLERLQRDGLVAEFAAADPSLPSGDNVQRIVALTEAGHREVKEWLLDGVSAAPPARDELVIKVLVATGRDSTSGLAVIDQQRAVLLGALQAARRTQRTRQSLAQQMADDVFASRTEADLRWLDRCEARLQATDNPSDQSKQAQLRTEESR